jgi:hypothetical protein
MKLFYCLWFGKEWGKKEKCGVQSVARRCIPFFAWGIMNLT